MATANELKLAIDRYVDVDGPAFNKIVNGGDTETVETDAGTLSTFAKALLDFFNKTVRRDLQGTAPTSTEKQNVAFNAGIPIYSSLANANAVETHNVLFYNTSINRYQTTTV